MSLLLPLLLLSAMANDLATIRELTPWRDALFVATFFLLALTCLSSKGASFVPRQALGANKYLIVYLLALSVVQVFLHHLTIGSYLRLSGYILTAVLAYLLLAYRVYRDSNLCGLLLRSMAILSAVLGMTAILSSMGFSSFLALSLSEKTNVHILGVHATGGILGHPLTLGTQMVLGLGIALYLLRQSKTMVNAVMLVLICAGLLLSMARGAWLAATVGLFYYMLPTSILRRRTLAFVVLPVIAVLVFSQVYQYAHSSPFFSRALRIESGLSKRDILWMFALGLFRQSPLTGHGFLSSDRLIREYGLYKSLHLQIGTSFHNNFIDTAVQSGIVVLLSYMLLFLVPMYRLVRSTTIDDDLRKLLLFACVVVLVSIQFVNYNIGGLRLTSLSASILLGMANLSCLPIHRLLFSIKYPSAEPLNEKDINDLWQVQMVEHGLTASPNPTISVEEEGTTWKIIGRSHSQQQVYIISRDVDQLSVYRVGAFI